MKRIALIIGLILPLQVAALEYQNLSLYYTDAPFNPAEAAGISLLTSLHAIQGNPDGTFLPNRTLNRAEFLKIALASSPSVRVSLSDAGNCFPDVQADAWYSQYVCLAKMRGMVSGYPDGTFKPERSVNYAEALKMLGELYEYVAYSAEDEEWFAGYVRAAQFNKTALPSSLQYDRALTRGQMARLAAAFRAKEEGELETYRLAEKDLNLVIAKQKSSASSSSVSSYNSSSSLSSSVTSLVSSASSASSLQVLTAATSQFLLLGSHATIATAEFTPRSEPATIGNITVKFREKAKNITRMYLIDETGLRIAELRLDVFDSADETWKADTVQQYTLPSEGKVLGIEAEFKSKETGFPEELIQIKWVSMNVSGKTSKEDYQLIGMNTSYPQHQTASARIAAVRNNRPPIMDIGAGDNVLLGEFAIDGEYLDGAEVRINHLTFTVAESNGVTLSQFVLGALHSVQTIPCSIGSDSRISCSNIPASIGVIENQTIIVQLWGKLEINESIANPSMQINIEKPGILSTSIQQGEMGHLRWTDGQGSYNWVEMGEPVSEGSIWK